MVFSNRLVELHLENIHLKDSFEWDLILDCIPFSSLRKLNLRNRNVQGLQLRKAVKEKTFLQVTGLVGELWKEARNVFMRCMVL